MEAKSSNFLKCGFVPRIPDVRGMHGTAGQLKREGVSKTLLSESTVASARKCLGGEITNCRDKKSLLLYIPGKALFMLLRSQIQGLKEKRVRRSVEREVG